MISEIISKYSQRNIFGRDSTLIAIPTTTFLGRIVRGHHSHIIGFDIVTLGYLTTSTPITALPTGIKILNRPPTIRTGCFYLSTSLLFILGFTYPSSFGGLTGIILANRIIDTLSHDTYSVVGHPIMFLLWALFILCFPAFIHILVTLTPPSTSMNL